MRVRPYRELGGPARRRGLHLGVAAVLAGLTTGLMVSDLLLAGIVLAAVTIGHGTYALALRRAGLDIDERGLELRGPWRRRRHPWATIESVTIDWRGHTHTGPLHLRLHGEDLRHHGHDALAGLASPRHRGRRRAVEEALRRYAGHHGIPVTIIPPAWKTLITR